MLSIDHMRLDGPLAQQGLKAFKYKPVRPHKRDRLWFILADNDKAHIYRRKRHKLEMIGSAAPSIPYKKEENNTTIGRESIRGAAGREVARHGFEPSENSQTHEDRLFIASLADYLNTALEQDTYDKLILIAAPKTLGMLRDALNPQVNKSVLRALSKDLTNMPEQDVKKYLEKITFI